MSSLSLRLICQNLLEKENLTLVCQWCVIDENQESGKKKWKILFLECKNLEYQSFFIEIKDEGISLPTPEIKIVYLHKEDIQNSPNLLNSQENYFSNVYGGIDNGFDILMIYSNMLLQRTQDTTIFYTVITDIKNYIGKGILNKVNDLQEKVLTKVLTLNDIRGKTLPDDPNIEFEDITINEPKNDIEISNFFKKENTAANNFLSIHNMLKQSCLEFGFLAPAISLRFLKTTNNISTVIKKNISILEQNKVEYKRKKIKEITKSLDTIHEYLIKNLTVYTENINKTTIAISRLEETMKGLKKVESSKSVSTNKKEIEEAIINMQNEKLKLENQIENTLTISQTILDLFLNSLV